MIKSHATWSIGIQVPFHSTLGKRSLRVNNLLKEWVFSGFLGNNLIEYFELVTQNAVWRFVELNALGLLHFIVGLGVAINRFPGHISRSGFDAVVQNRTEFW